MGYVIQLLKNYLMQHTSSAASYRQWIKEAQEKGNDYGVEVYSKGLAEDISAIAYFFEAIKYLELQSNNVRPPQLNKHDVSGRSEQLPPSPYQWLKAKYQIPEGSTYVQPKDITMTQAAGWISEYVQLFGGNCH